MADHATVLRNLLPPSVYESYAENLSVELEADAHALDYALAAIEGIQSAYEGSLAQTAWGLPDPLDPTLTLDRIRAGDTYTFTLPRFTEVLTALSINVVRIETHKMTGCIAPCTAIIPPYGWRAVVRIVTPNAPAEPLRSQIEARHVPAHVRIIWSS